jgi:signal transduction histidine kinase
MPTPIINNSQKFKQLDLDDNVIFQKQRKQKKRAVVLASFGFIIMALGLSFIEGVTLINWSIGMSSTLIIWGLMWLTVHFKLDLYITFDPRFLLIPAAFSGVLICIFIHIFPDIRTLLLSGWYVVLLFGAGQLSFKNVIYLNLFMGIAHATNIALLIYNGEDLLFSNEMGLLLPYIVVWSYLARVLEKIKKGRDENREMRKMLSHLLIKKDQLLTDVSHELATPLTVLKLKVESLKDNLEVDVNATYDALDVKLTDLEKLIDDIQEFSQSDSGTLRLDFQTFNLQSALYEWQSDIEFRVEASNLTCKFINNVPTQLAVHLDKDKLKQVLVNIIANSVKYTDVPGLIQIEGKIIDNKFHLTIEDSAPNIQDKHLNKIFERLYRVDSSRSRDTGGSGLGLAICKGLVEAQNGTIVANQSPLGGLKITIEFSIDYTLTEHIA